MILAKFLAGRWFHRPSSALDVTRTDQLAARPGASRRAHRARPLIVETMERRLVLSANVVLTNLSVISAADPAGRPLIPTGANPPGVQHGGDVAVATFSLVAGTGYTGPDIRVGLADYTASTYPPAQGRAWLDTQVYFDSSSAILNAAHPTVKVYVNLAHSPSGQGSDDQGDDEGDDDQKEDCFQQLDAFYYLAGSTDNHGGLVTKFSGSDYYNYDNMDTNPNDPNHLLGGAVIDCEPANDPGCHSQSYYASHKSSLPDFMAIGNQVYTSTELVTLLKATNAGDATLNAVQQEITAYANLENGKALTTDVSNALRDSNLVLDKITAHLVSGSSYNKNAKVTSASDKNALTSDAGVLFAFNCGCDDNNGNKDNNGKGKDS